MSKFSKTMKKVFPLLFVSLCFGFITAVLWANPVHAQKFPGDGYPNPDFEDVSGHGPQLRYKNNGDGTFTDKNTGFVWEIKTNDMSSIHYVNNTYTWANMFTVFLDTLNNTCRDDETFACESDADCDVSNGGPGGPCGFAGHRDWCIPHVKLLQSIVDYSTCEFCDGEAGGGASSVPGETDASAYWSATTFAQFSAFAWFVNFNNGGVSFDSKSNEFRARAVRPCR